MARLAQAGRQVVQEYYGLKKIWLWMALPVDESYLTTLMLLSRGYPEAQ